MIILLIGCKLISEYDQMHLTTLCGGLWSDCIEQFTIFFFLEEIWQMPHISESRADHNTGNYDPYFFQ